MTYDKLVPFLTISLAITGFYMSGCSKDPEPVQKPEDMVHLNQKDMVVSDIQTSDIKKEDAAI